MSRRKKISAEHPELGLPEVRPLLQTSGLFSDHYLKARITKNDWWPSDEQARAVWQFCKELYERRYLACAKNNEAFTRQELLNPILAKLGFAWTDNLNLPDQDAEPDYILFASAAEKESVIDKDTARRYRAAAGLLEAKKLNHPLSQISKHQQRYPHQQIRDYLNEAQVRSWGILTNGNEWRLYCRDAKPSHYFALNFEVAINSLDNFKVFLALFSPAAFVRDAQGKCRLDAVRESAIAAQSQLEADLRQRIFGLVELLANGFAEHPENGIADSDLSRLYSNCLIFLYRLLFILYAEGRDLLPVERPNRKYYKQLSLARLVGPLKGFMEYHSSTQTRLYREVLELCHLINGTNEKANKEFDVPRYNGGLFDPDRHADLERWVLSDAVLADVLRGLIFNPIPNREQLTLPIETVDYADLSVQQLGSIYEGLMEHHFQRDNKTLRLVADNAERRQTGTYYTPDYIVKYIVEHTIGPLLAEIEQNPEVKAGTENAFANEILRLNICDPAMGSGHFLVEATIYLAEHIVYHPTTKFQAEFQRGQSQEEQEIAYWRRRVVEACIYGVDLNPLAVELAKLSLWLTTIASDQPLNFLDHHLRCGNSLIGARLDQLSRLPGKKGRARPPGAPEQIEFTFGPDLKNAVAAAIREIQRIEAEASSNVDKVKDKEKVWQEKVLPALAPYKAVADLWTSVFFGNALDEETYVAQAQKILAVGRVPSRGESSAATPTSAASGDAAYNRIVAARRFFHWELEFPDIFFGDDGAPKPNPGFDAVIGNPPYVSVINIEPELRNYLLARYGTATGRFDLYIVFTERGLSLLRESGLFGFIEPIKFAIYANGKVLRDILLTKMQVEQIVDVSQCRVFPDPTIYPCLPIIRKQTPTASHQVQVVEPPTDEPALIAQDENYRVRRLSIPQSRFLETPEHIICVRLSDELWKFVGRIGKSSTLIGDLFEIEQCIRIGSAEKRNQLVLDANRHARAPSDVKSSCRRMLDGENIARYLIAWEGQWLHYLPEELYNPKSEAVLETVKLLIKRIAPSLSVVPDLGADKGYFYPLNTIYALIAKTKLALSYYYYASLLNSRLLDWYYKLLFEAIAIRGGYIEYREYLAYLPIRDIAFTTPPVDRKRLGKAGQKLYEAAVGGGDGAEALRFVEEQLAAKRSDVVHDLLALLAERMMELNRQKQTASRQFLADLKDFHGVDVHSLKPKTKLDEFWKLEASDLFAHLRANAKLLELQNVRLKESDDEKIRDRFQKAKSRIIPLESTLFFTDRLIDQIVYRLYGLTDEEIKIVEGQA